MTKEDLIKLGVSDDIATKIADDQAKNFIPKAKFNEVTEAKKNLESQAAEHEKQLKTLKEKANGNDELQKTIKGLQDANKAQKDDFNVKLQKMSIDNTVNAALTASKAKNNSAVKAMLGIENYELDSYGKVKGLEDAIATAKKDNPWAFESDDTNKGDKGGTGKLNIGGFTPNQSGDNTGGGEGAAMESEIWNALNGK
jgi:ABC-type proline/glycine betaine transport system ATPase subunit